MNPTRGLSIKDKKRAPKKPTERLDPSTAATMDKTIQPKIIMLFGVWFLVSAIYTDLTIQVKQKHFFVKFNITLAYVGRIELSKIN